MTANSLHAHMCAVLFYICATSLLWDKHASIPRRSGVSLMQSRFKVTSSSSQKRSRIDIMADILGETLKGARKTHIMYNCNLSHNQLHAYLKLLLAMEFLELRSKVYKATAKGLKFLDAYLTLEALMP
jgi:predicted transcriptional regulator